MFTEVFTASERSHNIKVEMDSMERKMKYLIDEKKDSREGLKKEEI